MVNIATFLMLLGKEKVVVTVGQKKKEKFAVRSLVSCGCRLPGGCSVLPLKKTIVNGVETKKCLKAFPDYFVKIKPRWRTGPEIQTIGP